MSGGVVLEHGRWGLVCPRASRGFAWGETTGKGQNLSRFTASRLPVWSPALPLLDTSALGVGWQAGGGLGGRRGRGRGRPGRRLPGRAGTWPSCTGERGARCSPGPGGAPQGTRMGKPGARGRAGDPWGAVDQTLSWGPRRCSLGLGEAPPGTREALQEVSRCSGVLGAGACRRPAQCCHVGGAEFLMSRVQRSGAWRAATPLTYRVQRNGVWRASRRAWRARSEDRPLFFL